MSGNDYVVRPDGSIRKGDLGIEALEREQEILAARVQSIHDEARPMLKGSGFIVVAPSNPRFDGEEFEDKALAQERADEVAYQHGKAIIYAPVAIVKPRRETTIVTPSELLKQIGTGSLPPGQVKVE